MAKQYQNPCGIGNFRQATFSFWFRIPTSDAATAAAAASSGGGTGGGIQDKASLNWMGGIELLAFGQGVTDFLSTHYSSINLGIGDPLMTRSYTTSGNVHTSNGDHYAIGNNPSTWTVATWLSADPPHSDPDPSGANVVYSCDYDALGTAMEVDTGYKQFGHQAYLTSPFTYDVWHHLLIAIDVSSGDTYGNFPVQSFDSHVEIVSSITARGRIIEMYLDRSRVHGLYRSTADLTTFFTASFPTNWETDPTSDPCDLTIDGSEFSIPSFTSASLGHGDGAVTFNPLICYAEFQAWFGQYIDPASNLDKFVTSGGKPVPTSTAATAFGTQTLLFKGNHSTFSTNLGTGGAFTKTGSINDFSPGP